jgi:hypothetical protein
MDELSSIVPLVRIIEMDETERLRHHNLSIPHDHLPLYRGSPSYLGVAWLLLNSLLDYREYYRWIRS